MKTSIESQSACQGFGELGYDLNVMLSLKISFL